MSLSFDSFIQNIVLPKNKYIYNQNRFIPSQLVYIVYNMPIVSHLYYFMFKSQLLFLGTWYFYMVSGLGVSYFVVT